MLRIFALILGAFLVFGQSMLGATLASVNGKLKKAGGEAIAGKMKWVTLGVFGTEHTAKESTSELLEFANHGLKNGNMIIFKTLSSETVLKTGELYYVIKEGLNTFGLAQKEGGAAIKWSGALEGKYVPVTEVTQVEKRIATTLASETDKIEEDKTSRAIKTTAGCTVNCTLYGETESAGELVAGFQLPEPEVIAAAATVSVLLTKVTTE